MFFLKEKQNVNHYVLHGEISRSVTCDALVSLCSSLLPSDSPLFAYVLSEKYVDSKIRLPDVDGSALSEAIELTVAGDDLDNASSSIQLTFGDVFTCVLTSLEDSTALFSLFFDQMSAFMSIEYGYAYGGVAGKRTEMYAHGDDNGSKYVSGVSTESKRIVCSWGRLLPEAKSGGFRDFFEKNVFSEAHMDSIGRDGTILSEYVTKSPWTSKALGKMYLVSVDDVPTLKREWKYLHKNWKIMGTNKGG